VKIAVISAALALGSLGAACSDDADGSNQGGSNQVALPFGSAALAEDASRTIEVTTLDSMRFEPMSMELTEGEIVRFVVTNEGKLPHEFALGDEAQQLAHAEEMKGMGMMAHDHPYSVWVEPGETKEMAWSFSIAGEFLYACHVPGHYEAGMVGTLSVK
jgi:uncharacterized cupredoxin-like copper-binding protein